MSRMNEFWRSVRETEAALGDVEFVYITSIENRSTGMHGGVLCQASRENAATMITRGSHRVSTPEEVEAFLVEQGHIKIDAFHEGLKAQGKVAVSVPPAVKPK